MGYSPRGRKELDTTEQLTLLPLLFLCYTTMLSDFFTVYCLVLRILLANEIYLRVGFCFSLF